MADEEKHLPGEAGPVVPEPETPAPDGDKEKPTDEQAPAPEAEKPEEGDKPAEPAPIKKRSIYDSLKDARQERNEWKETSIVALKALGVELTGNEKPEELQTLLQQHKPAPSDKPAPKPAPADDLSAYAEEQGLDADALGRLVEIITKKVPATQLSDEDRQGLADLKTWRSTQAREAEDRDILATAPTVKTQLDIHDDKELKTVMDEIVRLAHTPEFHDKETDYIVWKKKDALSKLVSPKKPSFEQGGSAIEADGEAAPDFSSGKVTPQQAGKAITRGKSALEVRSSQ